MFWLLVVVLPVATETWRVTTLAVVVLGVI